MSCSAMMSSRCSFARRTSSLRSKMRLPRRCRQSSITRTESSRVRKSESRRGKIRDMTEELKAKDFELEHQQTVIERLRSQKRALKAKIEALTTNVEEYKTEWRMQVLPLSRRRLMPRSRLTTHLPFIVV